MEIAGRAKTKDVGGVGGFGLVAHGGIEDLCDAIYRRLLTLRNSQELSELGLEDTVGDKLSLLGDLRGGGHFEVMKKGCEVVMS